MKLLKKASIGLQKGMKKAIKEKRKKPGKAITLRRQMVRTVNAIFVATIALTVIIGIIASNYSIKDNVKSEMGSIRSWRQ